MHRRKSRSRGCYGDHIKRVPTCQSIEQFVSYGANARTKGVHRALVERLGHKSSYALMVRIIEAKLSIEGSKASIGLIRHQDAPKIRARRRLARID
jgi:hypothetical protein